MEWTQDFKNRFPALHPELRLEGITRNTFFSNVAEFRLYGIAPGDQCKTYCKAPSGSVGAMTNEPYRTHVSNQKIILK